jgi:glycosyltransferase involved in cell wall biosynthesis
VGPRVLVVAYLYPPAGGGGVQRTAGFVRHLPDFGWSPEVVAGTAEGYWARDPSLEAGLAAPVTRVPLPPWDALRRWTRRALPPSIRAAFDASRLPDVHSAWILPAFRAAARRHARRPFDVIYSTGPPWTDHVVAALLARRFGLPWVADFRDPWAHNPLQPPPRALAPAHRALEAWVHGTADLSIASTEGYRRAMAEAFDLPPGATMHLPNGFTESDFPGLPAPAPAPPLRLGYAGSFYGAHGPEALFDALEAVAIRDPELGLTVELFGMTGTPRARAFTVNAHGYVPQRAALEGLARCPVVFLTVPDRPGAEGCVPQKLYVYLRLGRPILWCGPEGDATAILRRAGGTHFALDPRRPDLEGLGRWLRARVDEAPPAPFSPEVVGGFDRRVLTGQLAGQLAAVSRRTRSG